MIEVVSVRFRGGCKNYYFDPHGITVCAGQNVVVETAQGIEFAQCVAGNHTVAETAVVQPLRPVLRLATENDERTVTYNRKRESEAFDICEKMILDHALDMKLVRVECNFDGNKIIFFFTAEGRVDFRELVKDLASVFRARIELRQIGVRDEAKMLGGLGICGRPFCCSEFLEEFMPVSIKMAKTQSLSLNPTKISGTCGRLMCCLKYEQNAYEDAVKRVPKNDSFVLTPDGPGNITNVDLLREKATVRLDSQPESPKKYRPCEMTVLRAGKGARDGIDIPAVRPARYVAPVEELPAAVDPMHLVFSDPVLNAREEAERAAAAAAPAPDTAEGRGAGRGRNHRGGRGGKRPSAQEARPAKGEQPGKAGAGAKNEQRPPRGARPAPKGGKPRTGDTPVNPAAEHGGAEQQAHRSRHHRGGRGRRHGGSNGGASGGSAE